MGRMTTGAMALLAGFAGLGVARAAEPVLLVDLTETVVDGEGRAIAVGACPAPCPIRTPLLLALDALLEGEPALRGKVAGGGVVEMSMAEAAKVRWAASKTGKEVQVTVARALDPNRGLLPSPAGENR